MCYDLPSTAFSVARYMAHGSTSRRSLLKTDITVEEELRRSLLACILWNKPFTENGVGIAQRIRSLIELIPTERLLSLMTELRDVVALHRAHLMLIREMARTSVHRAFVRAALQEAMKDPNDVREFLSIYWRDGKQPLSAQVKKGLSAAIGRFSAYEVIAPESKKGIKLRDALFLCHPKPSDIGQEIAWEQIAKNSLDERSNLLASSAVLGREQWEELLRSQQLGGGSWLDNIAAITAAKVDKLILKHAIRRLAEERVVPFKFLVAMRSAPEWHAELEEAMMQSLSHEAQLGFDLALVVNVHAPRTSLPAASTLLRGDCAFGLAILLHVLARHATMYVMSPGLTRLYPYRSLGLLNSMTWTRPNESTNLPLAIEQLCAKHERIFVVSDGRTPSLLVHPKGSGVLLNIASRELGIVYGDWTRVDGWSDQIIDYTRAAELPMMRRANGSDQSGKFTEKPSRH